MCLANESLELFSTPWLCSPALAHWISHSSPVWPGLCKSWHWCSHLWPEHSFWAGSALWWLLLHISQLGAVAPKTFLTFWSVLAHTKAIINLTRQVKLHLHICLDRQSWQITKLIRCTISTISKNHNFDQPSYIRSSSQCCPTIIIWWSDVHSTCIVELVVISDLVLSVSQSMGKTSPLDVRA